MPVCCSAGLIKCGACSKFCVRGLSCSTNKIAFYKKVCTTNAVLQRKYNTLAISLKLAQLRSFRRILIAENFAIICQMNSGTSERHSQCSKGLNNATVSVPLCFSSGF